MRRFRRAGREGHWVDTRAPSALRPYLKLARMERLIGWWLPLPLCWWAAGLAAIAAGKPFPDPRHRLPFFFVGAVVEGARAGSIF